VLIRQTSLFKSAPSKRHREPNLEWTKADIYRTAYTVIFDLAEN